MRKKNPMTDDKPMAPANLSIGSVLDSATRTLIPCSESARLDAELLLAHLLGKDRTYLRAWPEIVMSPVPSQQYAELIEARKHGMPVAYLITYRDFWSGRFKITPEVLIPRPETELLVEMSLARIPVGQAMSVLELGTGSGIIAISLAMERPEISILATDISAAALEVARENAEKHRITQIDFRICDWFESIPGKKFDLIVSNPPYVAKNDPHLNQGDLRFEPKIALESGDFGLDALKTIADNAREWMQAGGTLLLEHGYQQAGALHELLHLFGYCEIRTRNDLQGHPRVTQACWA